MKKSEKKMLISHIDKDSAEFRSQLKDDKKLKAKISKKPKKKEKEEKGEKKEPKGK